MWLEMLPAVMTVFGSIMGAKGSEQAGEAAARQGERAKAAANFTADQLDQQAGQIIAVSQRQAIEDQRQARLVQSRAIAVAAASGGGLSDPTIVNLLGRIKGEGAYRAALDLYQGTDRARTTRLAAEGKRYEGELSELAGYDKQEAYKTHGISTLATGAGNLFMRYGMGGPKAGGGTAAAAGPFDYDF